MTEPNWVLFDNLVWFLKCKQNSRSTETWSYRSPPTRVQPSTLSPFRSAGGVIHAMGHRAPGQTEWLRRASLRAISKRARRISPTSTEKKTRALVMAPAAFPNTGTGLITNSISEHTHAHRAVYRHGWRCISVDQEHFTERQVAHRRAAPHTDELRRPVLIFGSSCFAQHSVRQRATGRTLSCRSRVYLTAPVAEARTRWHRSTVPF